MIEEVELAWLAGLFEGEGSISFAARGYHNLNVTVANSDLYLIEPFSRSFGGKVYDRELYGQSGLIWRINGKKALDFLADISPFFHSKRRQKQVSIALQYPVGQSGVRVSEKDLSTRKEIQEQVMALNRRERA